MNIVARIGSSGIATFRFVGGMGYLFKDTLRWLFLSKKKGLKIRWGHIFDQMVRLGFDAIPIVTLVLFFVGMVLAIQMAYILKTFGVLEYIADVVGISMTRELAPLLTAIVLSGFAGAAVAAEIGTMAVSEEILALETSAIDPTRFLVLPRLFGSMVMGPCLTIFATYVGIAGGLFVSCVFLGIDPIIYITRTIDALKVKDVVAGLLKAEAFAIVVLMIACYLGMNVKGGAEGVGLATTRTVVLSIIGIIIVDCLFTTVFYFVF